MINEKNFSVGPGAVGERLDKWLCGKLSNFSRKQIKMLLDDGRVIVNGRRVVIAGWELEKDDSVVVRIPANFGNEGRKEETESERDGERGNGTNVREAYHKEDVQDVGQGVARSIERHIQRRERRQSSKSEGHVKKDAGKGRLRIYFEDKDVIVVEKPAGIQAASSKGDNWKTDSLLNRVHAYMKRRHKGSKGSFVFPLHRLDEETSGVMVFALSNVGRQLERQFRDHSIRREYVAIVEGKISSESGVIKRALEKGEFGHGRKVRVSADRKARHAITEYRVGERYKEATLVNLNVKTGRTHQIRVHLSSEGHPIIGDKLYRGQTHGNGPKLPRQALHAKLIIFKHPRSGRKMKFSSPIPNDMRALMENLRMA